MSAFEELITKFDNFCGEETELGTLALTEMISLKNQVHDKDMEIIRLNSIVENLQSELNKRPIQIMTESEYKDYLSEQDRIKRQEEEQR